MPGNPTFGLGEKLAFLKRRFSTQPKNYPLHHGDKMNKLVKKLKMS
jgi:hypothetical protein